MPWKSSLRVAAKNPFDLTLFYFYWLITRCELFIISDNKHQSSAMSLIDFHFSPQHENSDRFGRWSQENWNAFSMKYFLLVFTMNMIFVPMQNCSREDVITVCFFALVFSPDSVRMRTWMMKACVKCRNTHDINKRNFEETSSMMRLYRSNSWSH